MNDLMMNHYEICCLLYSGNIEEAQKCFSEKTKGLEMSPPVRYTYLSSLNYAIYYYILFYEKVSLSDCCLENEQLITHATNKNMLKIGKEIIVSYGMDRRYLIAKYKNPHIKNALTYIHSHLSKDLSLQMISDYVSIDKNYFCQLFKKEVGISFNTYVCTQRIKLAKKLLLGTTLSVQDIAEKCGFQTTSYFSTCCKKYIGYSPSEIRKQKK